LVWIKMNYIAWMLTSNCYILKKKLSGWRMCITSFLFLLFCYKIGYIPEYPRAATVLLHDWLNTWIGGCRMLITTCCYCSVTRLAQYLHRWMGNVNNHVLQLFCCYTTGSIPYLTKWMENVAWVCE
jgi:hypothetical protein